MKRNAKFVSAMKAIGTAVVGTSEERDGWPGILTIKTTNKERKIALHVSSISPHSRASYEMRFQNPANVAPVMNEGGSALPILIGLDDDKNPTVFVAVDGTSRLGRTTRFSVLFHDHITFEARSKGWAVYQSSSGENVYAFVPALLPVFIEQLVKNEFLPPQEISSAAVASGVLDAPADDEKTGEAAKRATRAVNVLVRKASTGRKIKLAYGNQCAMCGMTLDLLEGAHIFPVEAPGSSDEVWNGMSLCRNHHGALDNHLIWIDPASRAIQFRPDIHAKAQANTGIKYLLDSTKTHLILPASKKDLPRPEMFEKRYAYFPEHYLWVKAKP